MLFTPPQSPQRLHAVDAGTATSGILIPDLDPFDERIRPRQVSTIPVSLPKDCICESSILDCQAHQAPIKRQSLQMTGSTNLQAIHSYTKEPFPGLNKFGDIPNPHTQRKAARRRKNQLLRQEDPERYYREMADKKAIRDAQLRDARRHI